MMRAGAVILVMLATAPALAQPADARKEAAAQFSRGQAAQNAGRYREAIEAYEQAYALVPHGNTLYNIAVCHERLGDWGAAADYYQRYLDREPTASDAAEVEAKIRELRAKAEPSPPPPDLAPDPLTDRGTTPPPTTGGITGFGPPPTVPPEPRWHAGASYGLGFGDVTVQRFTGYAGMRFAKRLELDAVIGAFGKNDYALGAIGRVLVLRRPYMVPFLRAAATIGYAKQDASSIAETKLPLGFEAGGGARFGAQGWIEVDLVVRWIVGGWDSESTTADSYVNDAMAIAFDVGVTFDFPFTFRSRSP